MNKSGGLEGVNFTPPLGRNGFKSSLMNFWKLLKVIPGNALHSFQTLRNTEEKELHVQSKCTKNKVFHEGFSKQIELLDTGPKFSYIRHAKDVLDLFWPSRVRSTYVLCCGKERIHGVYNFLRICLHVLKKQFFEDPVSCSFCFYK